MPRLVRTRPGATRYRGTGLDRDPELEDRKRDTGHGRRPTGPDGRQGDEAEGGELLDVRMDVFEVAPDEVGELRNRGRSRLSDGAEQLQSLWREHLPSCLQAREVGAATRRDCLASGCGFPSATEVFKSRL